jgi:hypothetical protein
MRAKFAITIALCGALAACGLNLQSPDLFLLTRTGQGQKLTLLVNDSGTIRCDGGATKTLPGPLLLQARDLATSLDNDAKAGLRFQTPRNTVFAYAVKLQDGTLSFPDTAAAAHIELARAEQFVLQAAEQVCGLRSSA